MNVQELLNRNAFLEDEVHRCYAEIEDYEVMIADHEKLFDEIEKRLKEKYG